MEQAKATDNYAIYTVILLGIFFWAFSGIVSDQRFKFRHHASELSLATLHSPPEVALVDYIRGHQKRPISTFEVAEIKYAVRNFNLSRAEAVRLVGRDIVSHNNRHYFKAAITLFSEPRLSAIYSSKTLQRLAALNFAPPMPRSVDSLHGASANKL